MGCALPAVKYHVQYFLGWWVGESLTMPKALHTWARQSHGPSSAVGDFWVPKARFGAVAEQLSPSSPLPDPRAELPLASLGHGTRAPHFRGGSCWWWHCLRCAPLHGPFWGCSSPTPSSGGEGSKRSPRCSEGGWVGAGCPPWYMGSHHPWTHRASFWVNLRELVCTGGDVFQLRWPEKQAFPRLSVLKCLIRV